MNFEKFLPAKVKRFLNTGDDDAGEKNDGKAEQHELTTVTSNKDPEHQAGPSSTAKEVGEAGIIQLKKDNCENVSKALDFFKSSSIEKSLKDTEKVSVIKFEINELFSELTSFELDRLSSRCSKNSIVIFFASKSDRKFSIYWKSKEIECFLTLKSYNSSLMETSRALFEFIAKFLTTSLNNNHLGIRNSSSMKRETTEFELHFLADHREYNVLLAAAETGDVAVVEILLKLGIETDSPFKDVNAQSLAYNGRHFHVLLLLFQSNLRYPALMDTSQCSNEVQSFVKMCNELHDNIKANNRAEVSDIVTKNSNLRYFYNESNESAAATALRSNSLNIYEDLMMKEVYFGPHENTGAIMEELDYATQRTVRELHFAYSKDLPESHINILMANSYVGHDVSNVKEKLNLVQHAFNVLNSYTFIRIILMVVAASRKFRIIFDFNRDNVHVADPTSNAYTNGIFYVSGRIYIGARQLLNRATENEALGTLAHELCHYAINLAYNNDAKPYKLNDNQSLQEFEKISESCKKNSEKEEVVDLVYGCYPEDMFHAELAVRAAHLTALYHGQPEKLQESKENFPKLFKFMEEKVGPEMEEALPDIESKVDKEIKGKDKKISKLRRNFYISIGLGIVIACLASWYFHKPTYMFSNLSVRDQKQVQNAFVSYKNVSVKLSDLFPGNSSVYEKLTSDHISQLLDNQILDFDDPQLHYLDEQVRFKWENLTEKLEDKFLASNLNFQGETVEFKDLNESCFEAFHVLTPKQINQVLCGEKVFVGKYFKSEIDFYMERTFISDDAEELYFEYEYGYEYIDNVELEEDHKKNRTRNKNFKEFFDEFLSQGFDACSRIFDEVKKNLVFRAYFYELDDREYHFMYRNSSQIIEQAQNERIFILSSEAGAGKTVTFERLAIEMKKKFPTRWVSYIDLKAHTEFYKTSGSPENVEDLLSKILRLSVGKNEFEVRIFEESYRSGTAVLVWNGFDEISPTYNEFILNLIKLVHNNSKNIQLVCTRPLYSDQLSKAFKIRAWQLVPFDEEKKKEFLSKYFAFQNVSSHEIEQNVKQVQEIVQKLYYDQFGFAYKYETPLMLKLVAEIYKNENLFKSANIYGIYESFIEKKIEIWLKNNEKSTTIVKKILFGGSLRTFFQKYALLNELYAFGHISLGLKIKKLQIMQKDIPKGVTREEISSMGILYINEKNNFEFAHKTFSDFLVAQYFIENIYDVDGDVNESEAELRLELFYYLTKDYGQGGRVILDFMSSFLQLNNENEDKDFNPTISELLRSKFRKFFIRCLDANDQEIFGFLFKFFKKDHNLLIDLLHVHEDETLYTAVFNPNHFAVLINPDYIKNLSQAYLHSDELSTFLDGKNQKGKILFGMQFYQLIWVIKSNDAYDFEFKASSNGSLWEFIRKIRENLTEVEQRELYMTVISPKIYMFYDGFLNMLFSFSEYEKVLTGFEHLLTSTEIQNALGNALIHYFEINPQDKFNHQYYLTILLQKVENFLSDFQIYEMFYTESILHEAHWDKWGFEKLWNLLSNHTSKEERKEILLQDDKSDKNLYFYGLDNDMKRRFSSYLYNYYFYDFTTFKIFHRSMTDTFVETFDFTKEIYHKLFNKTEMQKIILSSNEFIYYVLARRNREPCKELVSYLGELFEGNEKGLKKFMERKIKPTNLSVLEYVEDFRGLIYSRPDWFDNLKLFSDLYDRIKLL